MFLGIPFVIISRGHGGWQFPRSVVGQLENQEGWWFSSVWVRSPKVPCSFQLLKTFIWEIILAQAGAEIINRDELQVVFPQWKWICWSSQFSCQSSLVNNSLHQAREQPRRWSSGAPLAGGDWEIPAAMLRKSGTTCAAGWLPPASAREKTCCSKASFSYPHLVSGVSSTCWCGRTW